MDLQSRIADCRVLAEKGNTEQAQAELTHVVEDFCAGPKPKVEESKLILKSIESTAHRIGVNVALNSAEQFYQKGDIGAAREWLRYARTHAGALDMDIGDQVSTLKQTYNDRIPLFIWWV